MATAGGVVTANDVAFAYAAERAGCPTTPVAWREVAGLLFEILAAAVDVGDDWTPDRLQIRIQAARIPPPFARPWPDVPVPPEGAKEMLRDAEARAMLAAVQYPPAPPSDGPPIPRHLMTVGAQGMTLPDGRAVTVSFAVVLPGDEPDPLDDPPPAP